MACDRAEPPAPEALRQLRRLLAAVRLNRWQELSEAEREGLPPLGPDLVVELASPADEPQALRHKTGAYLANGACLGWLLLPQNRTVEV